MNEIHTERAIQGQTANSDLKVFHDIESYRKWRKSIPANETVGFVPTMGALHAGHARLLEISKKNQTHTVLSIFVNPTQFGPNEDLSKYPRTLEADLKIAESNGVAAVFVPTEKILYPEGYSTFVNEERVSQPLCGIYRPGHFRGVATIVLKLFNIIEPTRSYFGLKDAQQFYVIKKIVHDLNLNTEVEGIATVREESGLALSSRNTYLSADDRKKVAPKFYETLKNIRQDLEDDKPISQTLARAKNDLVKAGFDVQYLELRALPNLEDLSVRPEPFLHHAPALLAGALFLGKVRLIDNIILEPASDRI